MRDVNVKLETTRLWPELILEMSNVSGRPKSHLIARSLKLAQSDSQAHRQVCLRFMNLIVGYAFGRSRWTSNQIN